jgi:hypothetical protein
LLLVRVYAALHRLKLRLRARQTLASADMRILLGIELLTRQTQLHADIGQL